MADSSPCGWNKINFTSNPRADDTDDEQLINKVEIKAIRRMFCLNYVAFVPSNFSFQRQPFLR